MLSPETGWRETRLELDRYKAEYGQSPEWQPFLKNLEDFCSNNVVLAKITPEKGGPHLRVSRNGRVPGTLAALAEGRKKAKGEMNL
jgi:hypothetical protein